MPFSIKHLFSRWRLDNLKVITRVIVSVIGATVLVIGIESSRRAREAGASDCAEE